MERPDARQFLETVMHDLEEFPERTREQLLRLATLEPAGRFEAIKAALMEAAHG